VLRWTHTGGSPEESQEHHLTVSEQYLLGIPLHTRVHGPQSPGLNPPPVLVPRRPAPGQELSGVSHGQAHEYDDEYRWTLKVLGHETVQYRGHALLVWHSQRTSSEHLQSGSEDGTYVRTTDEFFSTEIGLLVKVTGHDELVNDPKVIYTYDFVLTLDGVT
jgi:hypothetical protein